MFQQSTEGHESEGRRADIVGLELWVEKFGFGAGEMAQ